MTSARTSSDLTVSPSSGDPSPPAVRAQTPGWRDPRLAAGVVIVAVCVLLGARVLAAADDTTAVWSLRHDVSAGATLDADDLTPVRVRLTSAAADRYLPASAALAPGATTVHDLAADELLPRAAIRADQGPALVEVPLSVAPDDLPASVRRGAVVDVWVTPKVAGAGEPVRARLALEDVVVVAVPARGDSLAPQTTQQVIVGVEESQSARVGDALGQLADGRVVLTRQAAS